MKRTTLNLTLAGISVLVIAGVEVPACRDLDRRAARYRNDKKSVAQHERDYQRPLLGPGIDQNAAPLYERALPALTKTQLNEFQPALDAGFERYDPATESLVAGPCAVIDSESIRTALQCSYCDWRLGFDAESIDRFKHTREALSLTRCFTIAGHRSAHDRDFENAARRYLDGLAVGCDLANGDTTMLVIAMGAVRDNLFALGRLASSTDDTLFLRRLAGNLSEFEQKLPDGRTPLMRERLWAQNQVSLLALENAEQGSRHGFVSLKDVMGDWSLSAEDRLFEDLDRVAHMTTRAQGYQLVDRLKAEAAASRSELVRTLDMPKTALIATNSLEMAGIFHAVQAVIELQQFRLEHGSYPPTATGLSVDLAHDEIRYQRSETAQGYKLSGPRGTLIER